MPGVSNAVFLSYASDDAEAAERIATALRSAGIEVWFDKSELRGGDAWDRQIRDQIHDCRLFVAVISAHTEARDEGYFRREWRLAVERAGDMHERKAFLVPVVIDGTSERGAAVPEKFRELQWTRLPAGETPVAFVERVQRLLSPEASTTIQPATSGLSGAVTPKPLRASWRSKPALLVIVVAAISVAMAYFVVDKLWPSKRIASSTASGSTSAQPQSTAAREKSIAVLPFADLSEKHDQEYFADGMAEEVIDLLARIPGLKVISRTSSFQFKGKNQDLRVVGNTLGVSYVVEGSVRRAGDRIRVTAQLINTQDGSHLWSDTYDQPIGDMLNVQDQVASSLVRALQVSVGADYQQARPSPRSVEAYDLYLRGRHAVDRFDQEGFESAATYFQQALDVDPAAVTAAEWLAFAQEADAEFSYVEPNEGFERARRSAQHALALDPKSSLAYVTLSAVHLIYDWDWPAAERDAKQALRLKPRDPIALSQLGQLYGTLGRWDDSARYLEAALNLDPLFAGWHDLLSAVRYSTGRIGEAEAEVRRELQISPRYGGAHYWLGHVLLAQGKVEAALAEMGQEQPDSDRYAGLAMVYHTMGRRAESDAALARQMQDYAQNDAYDIALVYGYRRELDRAFAWLDRAYRQKDAQLYGVIAINSDPLLKNFADDPRYKAFLRKMNLPE